MGVNPTVINFCRNFLVGRLEASRVSGVSWIQEDILVPLSLKSWYGGDMLLLIPHIGPTCLILDTTWKYKTNIYYTLKSISDINILFF